MSLALTSRRAALFPGRWVSNELWRRARAVPSLDLRFAENKSLVDATTGANLVTFTRASSGTFVDSEGVIQSASNDVPRFDHNPTTGESLGLLVEESRANLLLWSEEFDDPSWSTASLTITPNDTTAPNGTLTADTWQNTSTTGVISRLITKAAAATTYTATVWIKSTQATNFSLTVDDGGTTNRGRCTFDITTGEILAESDEGDFTNTSATIIVYPDSWYRISTSTTTNTQTTARFRAFFSGNGDTVYIWGAQLEEGASPTSYIPTTDSTVTRSADVASITSRGANIRSLYASFRSPASGTRPVVSLDDNSANERIEILTSGTDPKLVVTDGGSGVADLNGGTVTANVAARIAARFNTDDYAISINGGASQLDSSGTLPVVDRIRIGSNQAGGYFNGTIARIAGWDAGLPSLPPITQ